MQVNEKYIFENIFNNPTAINGFEIPESYAKTLQGENLLLYDSGSQDSRRILIFGTESG